MMVTTHAFASLLVCAPLALLFPDQSASIAVLALVGGAFPDVDVVLGTHRRTLHFPLGYWCLLPFAAGVSVVSGPVALGLVAFLLGAGLHSASDVLGGGLEDKPWEQTADRAVYCHASGAWLPPKFIIAYDGSKGDFLLTCLLAMSMVAYGDVPYLLPVVLSGVVFAAVYTIIRRRLPQFEDWLYENVPVLRPLLNNLY